MLTRRGCGSPPVWPGGRRATSIAVIDDGQRGKYLFDATPDIREQLFESMSAKDRQRVIFIHMNHTNPLLYDGSPEQAEVERRGFRFAREGLQLEL